MVSVGTAGPRFISSQPPSAKTAAATITMSIPFLFILVVRNNYFFSIALRVLLKRARYPQERSILHFRYPVRALCFATHGIRPPYPPRHTPVHGSRATKNRRESPPAARRRFGAASPASLRYPLHCSAPHR